MDAKKFSGLTPKEKQRKDGYDKGQPHKCLSMYTYHKTPASVKASMLQRKRVTYFGKQCSVHTTL